MLWAGGCGRAYILVYKLLAKGFGVGNDCGAVVFANVSLKKGGDMLNGHGIRYRGRLRPVLLLQYWEVGRGSRAGAAREEMHVCDI